MKLHCSIARQLKTSNFYPKCKSTCSVNLGLNSVAILSVQISQDNTFKVRREFLQRVHTIILKID